MGLCLHDLGQLISSMSMSLMVKIPMMVTYQHEFRINICTDSNIIHVWDGVISNFIVGPGISPNRLNEENLLED